MTTKAKDKMGTAFESWLESDNSKTVKKTTGLMEDAIHLAFIAGYSTGYQAGGDSAIETLEAMTQ